MNPSPTYIAVTRRPRGPVHLSEHGHYTLCQWHITGRWQRLEEPISLAVLLLSDGVRICRECGREIKRRHGLDLA